MNFLKKQNGQTLLEVIIAVFIISVSLISVLQLVIAAMQANEMAKFTNKYRFLSQELVEIIENIRDTTSKRLSNGDTSKYDKNATSGPASLPLSRWDQYLFDCDSSLSTCTNGNGYYRLMDYQPNSGWRLQKVGTGMSVTTSADGSIIDSSKPGYKKINTDTYDMNVYGVLLDETGNLLYGSRTWRYIYIRKVDTNLLQFSVRLRIGSPSIVFNPGYDPSCDIPECDTGGPFYTMHYYYIKGADIYLSKQF